MGFGLPAAIGAQFSCPDRPVVLVSGDGSIMMNIQELATVARCQLPIKMILLDNSTLGMVRQWQKLFFDRNYSEIDLSDNPDFAALCRVFRIPAIKLERREDTEAALRELLATPGPARLYVWASYAVTLVCVFAEVVSVRRQFSGQMVRLLRVRRATVRGAGNETET